MEVFTHNDDSKRPPEGVTIHDFSLLALRWIVALALVYFQGWTQIKNAWAFVWKKEEWPLLEKLAEHSIPMPHVLGPVLAVLLLLVAVNLATGFLTRIMALIGLTICLLLMVTKLELSTTLNAQTLIIYSGVLLVLAFSGGGRFSLDTLMTRRRKPSS